MTIIEELKYVREQMSKSQFDVQIKKQYYQKCYEAYELANWKKEKLEPIAKDLGIQSRTIINHAKKYAIQYKKMTTKEYYQMITGNLNEELFKRCYELCEQEYWQKDALEPLAAELGIQVQNLLNKAKEYAIKYKNMSSEQYHQMMLAKRREPLYKACYQLCKQADWQIENINQIPNELNLRAETIFEHGTDYAIHYLNIPFQDFNRRLEQKKLENLYKKCYELCEKKDWNHQQITRVAKQINMPIETILNYAKEYIKCSKKELPSAFYELEKEINKKQEESKINQLFRELLKLPENQPEEIVNLINTYKEKTNLASGTTRTKIWKFAADNYPTIQSKVIVCLERKIEIYKSFLKNQNNPEKPVSQLTLDEKKMILPRKYINGFIESNYDTPELYCSSINIPFETFRKKLFCCQRYDKNLYKKYLEELIKRNNCYHMQEEPIILAHKMLFLIKNGIIVSEHNIREFDVIDYNSMTKLTATDFFALVIDNLNVEEIRCLKSHFKKIGLISQIATNIILVQNRIQKIGYRIKDSENPEHETFYFPTNEENNFIINYLSNNNLPFNQVIYLNVLKRLLIESTNKANFIKRLTK